MKYYLILAALLFSCSKLPEPSLQLGACYRYPNHSMSDVNMKVLRLYENDRVLGEFIVNKHVTIGSYVFPAEFRHMKEVSCRVFEELKAGANG